MKAYMFPGQGSQAKGMGGSLFDEFADLTSKADEILGYSIKELCLEDPRRELGKTQFTQPALFVVNAMSHRRKLETSGQADFVAGHSLGEFNALLAAGSFDFETGLQLVRKRGELMSRAGSGAMAAILNASKEQIEAILRDNGLANVDLANYNSPSQIVISGARDEIAKAQHLFKGDMAYYPLNTSGAFHSRLMREAQAEFESYLQGFTLLDPTVPVIANVTARPYEPGAVAGNLARQVSSTVRWSESIQYLLQLASERGSDIEFEELGHGEVLTKLLRGIRQQTAVQVAPAPVPTPASTPAIAQAAAAGAPAPRRDAAEKVREWNSRHPVGTRVTSAMDGYGELETGTEAMVLFGHRAAVYMKGYNGYFDLDTLTPA